MDSMVQAEWDTLKEVERRRPLEQGQSLAGSMGPKDEGVVRFRESGGDRVIITSLEMAEDALAEKAGTQSPGYSANVRSAFCL